MDERKRNTRVALVIAGVLALGGLLWFVIVHGKHSGANFDEAGKFLKGRTDSARRANPRR